MAGDGIAVPARAPARHASLSPAFWIVLFLSLLPIRLVNIEGALLDHAPFRQTQTALTVACLARDRFTLLEYETPVLGPPWRVPFEFPIYQATAAVLVRAGASSVDVACRIASLLYFYASAAVLLALVLRFFGRSRAAVLAIAAYLFVPYGIFWSRAATIEHAAVFFSLLYLLGFLVVLRRRRARALPFSTALLSGVVAYCVKPTTVLAADVVIAFFLARRLRAGRRAARPGGGAGTAPFARDAAVAAALVVIPLLAGAAWTLYADAVKAASPFTAELTSESLARWTFGRWGQKLNPKAWIRVALGLGTTAVPYALAAALVAAAASVASRRARGAARTLVRGALVAPLVTIFVFFNLYKIHDYYGVALTPFFAIAVGYGADRGWRRIASLPRRARLAGRAVALVAAGASLAASMPYLARGWKEDAMPEIARLARAVRAATPEGERVIVADLDWHPAVLYYAGRRGLMVRPFPFDAAAVERVVREERFSTVVCSEEHPEIFALFAARDLVARVGAFSVYRVR